MIGTASRLLLVSVVPYFAWEMLQAPAFTGMPSTVLAATLVCAQATLGDMVILLVVYALAGGLLRDAGWFAPPRVGRYAGVAVLAGAIHVVVERLMTGLGRWGYAPGHPVIPVLDVGLLVVLQPLTLVPAVFGALAAWERRRPRSPRRARVVGAPGPR